MAKTDINQKVTNLVIEALEAGIAPWNCPMERDGAPAGMPVNAKTGNAYNGINTVTLWMGQQLGGYSSDRWLTYKQAQELGGQVKKGEKSTPGVFYKTLQKETEEVDSNGDNMVEHIPMIKGFSLFNLDQIEGLEHLQDENATGPRYEFTPIEAGERLMVAGGVTVHEGGPDAFYRPATDEITMPDRKRFADNADFYRVFAHELTHATKHESRCNRKPYKTDLPNGGYAFEEMVAQMGSAMVSAQIGLPAYIENDAAYIGTWLQALRNDKRLVFKAAAQAQTATDWIMAEYSREESAAA